MAIRCRRFRNEQSCGKDQLCGGSDSCLLAGRQAQTRQEKFAVLSVPQVARIWYHDRGNGVQPLDDRSCVVEPAHMRVAGGENTVRVGVARIILNREEQLRHGLIEAPAEKMGGAYPDEHRADAGARTEAQRCFAMLDRDVGLTRP